MVRYTNLGGVNQVGDKNLYRVFHPSIKGTYIESDYKTMLANNWFYGFWKK